MFEEFKDFFDELEILKDDINKKIYKTINNHNSNYEYKYFEYDGPNNLIINNSYGKTKEDFDKYFKQSKSYDSLYDLKVAGYLEYKDGFILKLSANDEVKDREVEKLIFQYINNIFTLLQLNPSKKIEFENFIHTFVLVSNKFSNFYDNALFDLDSFVLNKRKIKFVIDNFR